MEEASGLDTFLFKMNEIKRKAIKWIREKKKSQKQELAQVEEELSTLSARSHLSSFSDSDQDRLHSLIGKQRLFLIMKEVTWRLKSRALWIQEGDLSTKFFHAFSTQRKNTNAIW